MRIRFRPYLLLAPVAIAGCSNNPAPPVVVDTTPSPAVSVPPTVSPTTGTTDDNERMAGGHAKNLGLAVIMYQADADDMFPRKDDWVTEIGPYVKDKGDLKSPHHPDEAVAYAFNGNLSSVVGASLNAPALVVSLFETTATGNAPADGGDSWWVPSGGPLNATAFVDGHVKMLDQKPDAAAFAVK